MTNKYIINKWEYYLTKEDIENATPLVYVKMPSKFMSNKKEVLTITKSKQLQLHERFQYWKVQQITDAYCMLYALRDLGLPEDFKIEEYTIVEDTE